MKITAKSAGKRSDVRDACATLTMSAQDEEDGRILTRLYRYFSNLEADERTALAVYDLSAPITRHTRKGGGMVMAEHRGATQ